MGNDPRVLITGGAGFIGINLVEYLCETGDYVVTVFDNESTGWRQWLKPFTVQFIHGDICNKKEIESAVKDQDVVIHLAADCGVMNSIVFPRHNFNTNVVGSFNLLQACNANGVKRVIAASTGGAILGETMSPVNEDAVPRPMSPYGASKLAMEGYMGAFAKSYDMKNCSLRFTNVYGPYSMHKNSVVATFYNRILAGLGLIVYGDGSQNRDYIYVGDLVRGIVQAMDSEITGVYQLGTGKPTSLNRLITEIKKIVQQEDINIAYKMFRQGEIRSTWGDMTRARSAFGFCPETSLVEGLKKTWQWFKERCE